MHLRWHTWKRNSCKEPYLFKTFRVLYKKSTVLLHWFKSCLKDGLSNILECILTFEHLNIQEMTFWTVRNISMYSHIAKSKTCCYVSRQIYVAKTILAMLLFFNSISQFKFLGQLKYCILFNDPGTLWNLFSRNDEKIWK